jgi:hypothetical protein
MAYDYEWFSKYRPVAVKIAEEVQRRKTEPKAFRDLIKERDALEEQRDEINARLRELRQEVFENCPHKVKYQELHEDGREDDYGSYRAGHDHTLKCTRCRESIVEWGESGSFFGVDKNGKHKYGTKLEYYRKRYGEVEKYHFEDAEYVDE